VTPLETQFLVLKSLAPDALLTPLPSGAHLVSVPDVQLPEGWSPNRVTIFFIAPPGYPASQPDCFWAAPMGVRFEGRTPNGSNDANPIPEVPTQSATWFSWHIQHWNPNRDSLVTYFKVVKRRFHDRQ
jgi:hypothetical protein